ncbi:MAG: type II methionyl aminopeptidase [Candidatus Lokiarchaeota archaeon]|nr:type II methionyl aminopeptidase [Candidatus Lokiarchaeota archaeon]
MTGTPHPDFVIAGKIAARVMNDIVHHIKAGEKVLRICTLAEKKILEYGGKGCRPAFPCNISINQEAAHYTSPYGDTKIFPEKGLVKIDLGVSVNGYLSDTALTVDLDGSYEKFKLAAEDALKEAISMVRPGVRLGDIGSVIEKRIKSYGLKPVHQLSGHQLRRGILHAGKNVPNVSTRSSEKMMLGECYAIEPFSTDGNGTIRNDRFAYIFSNNLSSKKKLDAISTRVRNIARRKFGSLPWASRWLFGMVENIDLGSVLRTLVRSGVIHSYPVLLEGKQGMVGQAEHSVFVGSDGAIVTTRRN